MKINFNIVGLSHGAKKEKLMEYAHQAEGKRLALVMDNQNEFDPIAVAVKDGCERIGYVAAQDSEEVRAAMIASGRKMLLATCSGWGTKDGSEQGLYLTAEFCFEAKVPMEEAYAQIYDDSQFADWEYSGPTYCISQLSDIDSNTDMLEELLGDVERELSADVEPEHAADVERKKFPEEMEPMIRDLLADYLKNHCFDYSREMRSTRRRISELISGIVRGFSEENPAPAFLRQGLADLLADMGFITSSHYRERAARCFFIDTPRTLLRNHTGAYDYSDRLDEIERQLEAFPDNLYSYFKADPVDFLRRIFYRRVPRKQMMRLLSGIILMVENGRVEEVKQWGKRGDRESLEAMKCLGNHKKMDAMIRGDIVDACLVQISKATHKGGYAKLIKFQSDWYPIYRMLQELGEYGEGKEEMFCRRIASLSGKDGIKDKLCNRKDLTQAACDVFKEEMPSKWCHLEQERLKGVQDSKYNNYCTIIEEFLALLKEEAEKRGFQGAF